MNSYLVIAQEALRLVRRPLTSREIVEVAYRHGMVPAHLFGKTQHKTVGARLSEDILARRDKSLFFRSEPGRFFLREFLNDEAMPKAHRSPIIARRRQRDLRRGAALAISAAFARRVTADNAPPARTMNEARQSGAFSYLAGPDQEGADSLQVWSYVVFMRRGEILTYRHGRYREGRDSFLKRRSIGFFAAVSDRDFDLFNDIDLGIASSGLRAIAFDLDLPHILFGEHYRGEIAISDFVLASDDSGREDLLAIVDMECPPHFEPLTRRLAINDLTWLPLDRPVNHVEDFDPWSQAVMARRFPAAVSGLVRP